MPTKTPQPQVRAIIYTRAKAHNYASNTSDQEQKCKAFAQQQKMEIVGIVHEKLVGLEVCDKPGLAEVIRIIKENEKQGTPIQYLLVRDMDVLGRKYRLETFCKITETSVLIHSLDEIKRGKKYSFRI